MVFSREEKLKEIMEELKEFQVKYPTEAHCVEALFQMIFPDGVMNCRWCGARVTGRQFGSRVVNCCSCRKDTWFTAGTGFHRSRKVMARMATIWLMEKGILFNASILKEALASLTTGIVHSTAWKILNCIGAAISVSMELKFQGVDSATFQAIVMRRSRESPAQSHPRDELLSLIDLEEASPELSDESGYSVDENDYKPDSTDQNSAALKFMKNNRLNDSENKVLGLISNGIVTFDSLLSNSELEYSELTTVLAMLEIYGKILRDFGDRYLLKKPTQLKDAIGLSSSLKAEISKFLLIAKECFQGIGLRYLQQYLALYWATNDSSYWHSGRLLSSFVAADPFLLRKILQRASPKSVAVAF